MLISLAQALGRLFPPSNAVTEGPSPKVTVPTALLVLAGVALIVAGLIVGDADLVGYGVTVLGASGVVALAGSSAGPGSVVVAAPVIGTPSDDALPPAVAERIGAEPPSNVMAGPSGRAIGFARAEDKSVKAPKTTAPAPRPPAGSPDVKKGDGK